MKLKQIITVSIFAFIGWAICAAIMGVGPKYLTMQTTLILHAVGGPLGFAILSYIYHKKYNYTSPLKTAIIFIAFVILVDLFFISMVIIGNFDLFKSILGSWFPFGLIFLATYLIGEHVIKQKSNTY